MTVRRQELVFLDPVEVAVEGRTQINIHEGAIQVGPDGPDWGDYAVEQFKAKRESGEIPIGETVPNRIINIPLTLGASGDFDAARIALQAWVGEVNNSGGGWLKREMKGGSYGEAGKKLFSDIIKATLHLGDGTSQASIGIDPDAHLELEALPEFYAPREEAGSIEATAAGAKAIIVKGNLPARAEITVLDKSGNVQRGLAWAARCLNYSNASTAAWTLQAEALTPLEAAVEASQTGASGNTVRHGNLATNWTPVLSTNLKAGTYLTHKGLYDVWARVYTTSSKHPWLRLVYGIGDQVAPSENMQVQVPGTNGWYLVYLGQADLRPSPYGTHRWIGIVQARGPSGGENVDIDSLYFFCADEASGILSAPSTPDVPSTGYSARDRYLQAAGALTGKTAETSGKVYAQVAGSAATDFNVNASHYVERATKTDAGTIASPFFVGRAVGLSLALADQMAELSIEWSQQIEGSNTLQTGVLLKASNASNYVRVFLTNNPDPGGVGNSVPGVGIEVRRAGEQMVYGIESINGVQAPVLSQAILRAGIIGDDLFVFLNDQPVPLTTGAGTGLPIDRDKLSLLPAGGVYLADANESGSAVTRRYRDLKVWVPTQDAVLYANRSAKLSHLGMYRQDSTGTAYGPVAYPGSDLVRLPASGPAERPVEIAVKPSRGDFAALADSGLDKFQASLAYWPCWSSVPGL